MIKDLSIKLIYDDFINKIFLTNTEKEVLDMLILKESIIYISQTINISERSVSRIIRDLKDKYENYKETELAKANILAKRGQK